MLSKEMLRELQQPFPPGAVQWLPKATSGDKTRAMGIAYVDSRHYQGRLDRVAGPDWSDEYEIRDSGEIVICRLTIGGVTRCDVGEKKGTDENTLTSAKAQAFKRACCAFGLGRYLYAMPKRWAAYDAQRKQFAKEGLAELDAEAKRFYDRMVAALKAERENGNGEPLPEPDDEPPESGPTELDEHFPREQAQRPPLQQHQPPTQVDVPARNPKDLLEVVNRRLQVPYDNLMHLRQAIRQELGDENWNWPAYSDGTKWFAAYDAAMAHGKAKERGEAAPMPAPKFEDGEQMPF